jgi:dehydrogenase/reductase SDR family protein 7B
MAAIREKVIWITGASSGIGEAVARIAAEESAYLILSSRKLEALEMVRSSFTEAQQKNTKILPLDLSLPESLSGKASEALALFGRIDILVHSGGISQRSMAVDTNIEVDRKLMEVDYFSTVILTKAILPSMIENGFGHIVPISSLVGKFGSPFRSSYAAAKHALHGFYDSLRAEVFDKNIFITIVTPGFIKTNVSVNALTEDGKALNQMDEAQVNGMTAEKCARKIIAGIVKEKNELLIGGKERFGVYIMRFFPALFAKIVRKVKVR